MSHWKTSSFHPPDLRSHHLSSRKAHTPKVPQRKSPAKDNNKITQIQKSEWGKKNTIMFKRSGGNQEKWTQIFGWNSILDLTPRGPSSKLAFIVCGQAPFLTSVGWTSTSQSESVLSAGGANIGSMLVESPPHPFKCPSFSSVRLHNLDLKSLYCFSEFATKLNKCYVCYWLLPLFLPSASNCTTSERYSACFGFGTGSITAFNHLLFY